MGVNVRRKGDYYYLDIYHNGMRKWESTGLKASTNKTEQKEILRLLEVMRSKKLRQLKEIELGGVDLINSKKTLYQYTLEKAEKTKTNRTFKNLLIYLESFPSGEVITLDSITTVWADNFKTYLLKDSELSQSTASLYFSALKTILNTAVRENLITKNPASVIKGIPFAETEKIYLTPQEIQRLADTPINGKLGAEVKKAFLFACFTGLRISDLKNLTWGDIERNPLQIKKRQQKTKRFVYIPLNNNAWELIKTDSIHKHDEFIFSRLGDKYVNASYYFRLWAKNAGVEKEFRWHTARHTFATLSLESGADFFTVSKLLGHSKTAMTAVYTQATDKLKREAVNLLPEIDLKAGGRA